MTLRLAIMSDCHLEFDRSLILRAQSAAAAGRLNSDSLAWYQHLRDRRGVMPAHPWLGPDLYDAVGVDLLILAGDIGIGTEAIAYADEAARFCGCKVAFVPGNHEYYNAFSDMNIVGPDMRAAAVATHGRVVLLDNDAMQFGDWYILGTTLWTNYELNGSNASDIAWAMRDAQFSLTDHEAIRLRGNRFSPEMARGLHAVAKAWLNRQIDTLRAAEPQAKILVVTHHAVIGAEASAEEFRGGKLNPAFASDLRLEVAAWAPQVRLVVSGHTHHSYDVMVGDVRCLSHQRGYVGAEAGADRFSPLVIDI